MRRFIQRLVLALCLALFTTTAVSQTGCYGSFGLSTKLHGWNGSVTGNKFVNWLIFFVLIPIYGITLTIDAIVLNSIEFWTGSNPIVSQRENTDGTMTAIAQDGTEFLLTPTEDGALEIRKDGEVVGHARIDENGDMHVVDTDGEVVRHVTRQELLATQPAR